MCETALVDFGWSVDLVITVTFIDILYLVEFHSVIKIKVHNVFYTHTSIYSKLILTIVSNMFYNFLDFLTQ